MRATHVKPSAIFSGSSGSPLFVLRLLALGALLLPGASAQATLAGFEEPHRGSDRVWEFRVTPEEAGADRAIVYRNAPRSPFGLIVYDENGDEVFAKNGTRGVQTLPALDAATYRFFVRGTGEFQVTEKTLRGSLEPRERNATLEGIDAYVLAPAETFNVTIEGNVNVEWWDLTGSAFDLAAPFTRTADPGGLYVLTFHGDAGAPYSMRFVPGTLVEEPDAEAPFAPWLAAAAIAGAATIMRGTRRRGGG